MPNIKDFIVSSGTAKKIVVDKLLFAEFTCPHDEARSHMWCDNNFFAHALRGSTILKTPSQEYTLKAGDSAFARKGCIISQSTDDEEFCQLMIFVPDDFIRTVVDKYRIDLSCGKAYHTTGNLIPLNPSSLLETYFHSLIPHFTDAFTPPISLMKLKFEELILTLLSNHDHQLLTNYFHHVCKQSKPSIADLMETNFFSNLALEEFARLCGRSLSSFKTEFREIYNESPGKWLLEKRLSYSYFLLETTDKSIGDICFESGFENQSHFIRAFRNRYGLTPGKLRSQAGLPVHAHVQ
jgi:AraC-like DNA-binding protein